MIIDSFDIKSKAIVSLYDFYGEKRHIIEKCIIVFSEKIYDFLLKNYKCEIIAYIGACNGKTPIYAFEINNTKIGFYLTPIGSTAASQYTIECNWLTGANKFIMFGSCGSLDNEKTNGKFVVPTDAYRDEGMSYHYMEPSDYIKIKNAEKISNIMKKLKIPYTVGKTWTTDAMLRETVDQYNKRKDEGCIVVEMEIAGVQSVADFYGYEIFAFLQPGDVLLDNEYDISKLASANHDMDKLFIALEILKRI